METTTRPLTPKERADLARLASPRAQLSAELSSLAMAFVFTFAFGAGAALAAVGLLLHVRRGAGSVPGDGDLLELDFERLRARRAG